MGAWSGGGAEAGGLETAGGFEAPGGDAAGDDEAAGGDEASGGADAAEARARGSTAIAIRAVESTAPASISAAPPSAEPEAGLDVIPDSRRADG